RVHAPLAEGLVVLVGAARIGVAIQTDLDAGVLLHVLVELGDLTGLRAPDRAAIEVEEKVSERHPGPLRARLTLHTLGATHALRATRALHARHSRRPRLALGSLRARHPYRPSRPEVAGILKRSARAAGAEEHRQHEHRAEHRYHSRESVLHLS